MNSLVRNLWLIPALPQLAAALNASGAERRQPVAHGASRGIKVREHISSVGAKEPDGVLMVILRPLRGLYDSRAPFQRVSRGIEVRNVVSSVGATE